jgi:hypothetical membrane protein
MSTSETSPASTSRARSLVWRLCVWAGIIGPILTILVFTLDGALRPGYSAIGEAVSYLFLDARGWIEITNFIVLGLLLIVFAIGFLQWRRTVMQAIFRRVSSALLILSSLGFVMAALFLPDPFGEPPHTVHAMLHGIAFVVVFFPLGLACLLIGSQFRKIAGWRIHGWYSLITGVLTSLVALASLILPPSSSPPIRGGLFERLLFVIAFAWYVILASRMLMRERAGVEAPGQ